MKNSVSDILCQLLIAQPALEVCRDSIGQAFETIRCCYSGGGKVLICGNGGSASDSEHIVGELMKGFLMKREICSKHKEHLKVEFPEEWEYLSGNLQGALPAISLVSQSAISTAFINDVSPDMVFAQQVYGYGREGDTLIGLSTSGDSLNVVNAAKVARAFGLKTIGMTGESGGRLKGLCDTTIQVPVSAAYRVQEYHLPIYHALCAMLEAEFFEE